MIGKTLLNLDEIGHALAPHFDPNAAIRRHAAEITEQQMARDLSLASLFSAAVEMKNFVQHLPGRVNRILDRLADNEFRCRSTRSTRRASWRACRRWPTASRSA